MGIGAFLVSIGRQIWFRTTVITVAAIIVALAAGFIGAWIPYSLTVNLGQDSLGSILEILASSMLAVTTFSLTAMVTAFSSATEIGTPRATQLFVQDRTSQNTLATFLGAFAFSLVGIIALSTGYYTEQGVAILFAATLLLIGLVIVRLLRWISHLTRFGRMSDVLDRVEEAACAAIVESARRPTLGAHPAVLPPADAHAVYADSPAYVTRIDFTRLQRLADDTDTRLLIVARPGMLADIRTPLVRVLEGSLDEDDEKRLRTTFATALHRDFEHDPRLGVIALSEIGSRALAAATNDPGTAIEVLGSLERTFTSLLTTDAVEGVDFDRLHVPALSLAELVEDAFRPLSREAGDEIEVAVRLQKTLASLAAVDPAHAGLFASVASRSVRRIEKGMFDEDRQELLEVHRSLWNRHE